MSIQVMILLICYLVESKPMDGNELDPVKSLLAKADQLSYICELSPYSDEGPFFRPNDPERSNIIDGEPGIKLHLIIRLMNSRTCEPLRDVYVHIWHANAKGEYSGAKLVKKTQTLRDTESKPKSLNVGGEKKTNISFDEPRVYQKSDNLMNGDDKMNNTETILTPELNNLFIYSSNSKESNLKLHLKKKSAKPVLTQSPNFLRGYQISNYVGEVTFTTIMPGWYKDRVQHIHIEVHPDKSTDKPMYVGQLFFNKPVFAFHLPAWDEYTEKSKVGRLINEEDHIYKYFEGKRTAIELEKAGDNLQGIITLGVDPENAKIFD